MSLPSRPLLSLSSPDISRSLPDSSHCHPDASPLIPTSATVPSCLDPSSAFFRVLTAPYAPMHTLLPIAPQPVDPIHAERCNAMIDWSRRPITPESPPDSQDSSDEEDQANKADDAAYHENAKRAIYTPHGKWAWTDGLPMEDVKVVAQLNPGQMCSASVRAGTVGGRPITYVSKSWPIHKQDVWIGFHSELALYKSESFLRPLQGTVVPSVIGVHITPGEIRVSMEPPHHSFWIEASPDMPDVLKERCIAAFEKIHARKVLHGDPELRHMLIGADGKVTIIDFQCSRSSEPNDAVMLSKADPAEFQLEMRKIKFKLNYDGAREKEALKLLSCEARASRNRDRRRRQKRKMRGEHFGLVSDHEEDPPEDKADPPVHRQDFTKHWVLGTNVTPQRFVMPGQTLEDLRKEVQNFLSIVDRMEAEKKLASQNATRSLSTPPPSPPNSSPASSQVSIAADEPAPTTDSHKDILSREQPESSDDTRPTKRRRCEEPSTLAIKPASEAAGPSPPTEPPHTLDPLASTLPEPSTSSVGSNETAVAPEPSPTDPPSENPVAETDRRFPPIKVRDFAYEPYNGPRGYYVPHRPTECRAAQEYQSFILSQRRPRMSAEITRSLPAIPMNRGGSSSSSSKRARDEDPSSPNNFTSPPRKKSRYELARTTASEGSNSGKRRWDERETAPYIAFEGEQPTTSPRPVRSPRRPNPVTRGVSDSAMPSLSTPARILEALRKKSRKHGSQPGGKDLRVNTLRKTLLRFQPQVEAGARIPSATGSSSTSMLTSTTPVASGSVDRSGDLMALATLGMIVPSSNPRPRTTSFRRPVRRPPPSPMLVDEVRPSPLRISATRRKILSRLAGRRSSSTPSSPSRLRTVSLPPSDSRETSPALSDDEENEVEMLVLPSLQMSDNDEMNSSSSLSSNGWIGGLLRYFYLFG